MSSFPDSEVIAAIATPQGRGGIGVVRASGKDLKWFAGAILGRTPKPRHATRTSFIDAAGVAIDDGIAIYYSAPMSYTGEDVLELQGHGGAVVMQLVLRRCLELGARIADPGEFTRRAFLNDKLDLAQAESVADVIDAATEVAARCALRSLRGEFSAQVRGLVGQLVRLRTLTEANLDFPEEDSDSIECEVARDELAGLLADVQRLLAQGKQGSVLRIGLQVVLAGQPNVGKSSLLNRLAGEELAIVTEIPGTTRDTVRQTIQIEGVPMNIIDTAGLRIASDQIEAIGIARAWDAISKADVLLLVVDAGAGVTGLDRAIMERLPARLSRVVVHNKIDLGDGAPREANIGSETDLWVSAKTAAGFDELRAKLLSLAGWQSAGENAYMARERHLVALQRTTDCLARAEAVIGRAELVAEELRLAQSELNGITGEFTADDLLGEIFARFCIGK